MKTGKTEILIILDRSGSMANIAKDMEGGLKTFIEEQKNGPGECYVSLYKFNDQYEPVFEYKNVNSITEDIKVGPRGWTALYDAIGKTVVSVGERLHNTKEEERPEKVVVLIITDGEENFSKEYKAAKIKEIIETQKNQFSWEFVFLGANQDAITAGSNIGIRQDVCMNYNSNSGSAKGLWDKLSEKTTMVRSYATASYAFNDKDREEVNI